MREDELNRQELINSWESLKAMDIKTNEPINKENNNLRQNSSRLSTFG